MKTPHWEHDEGRGKERQERLSLKAKLAVTGLLRVQEQLTIEEIPLQELLQSHGLQANANQSNVRCSG